MARPRRGRRAGPGVPRRGRDARDRRAVVPGAPAPARVRGRQQFGLRRLRGLARPPGAHVRRRHPHDGRGRRAVRRAGRARAPALPEGGRSAAGQLVRGTGARSRPRGRGVPLGESARRLQAAAPVRRPRRGHARGALLADPDQDDGAGVRDDARRAAPPGGGARQPRGDRPATARGAAGPDQPRGGDGQHVELRRNAQHLARGLGAWRAGADATPSTPTSGSSATTSASRPVATGTVSWRVRADSGPVARNATARSTGATWPPPTVPRWPRRGRRSSRAFRILATWPNRPSRSSAQASAA